MKKILLAALVCFFAVSASAQSRVLLGVSGGNSFGNLTFGVTSVLEIPITKHFEIGLKDTFSPLETHQSLGHGMANIVRSSGIVWLDQNVGLKSSIEYTNYNVTKVSKGAYYAFFGPVVRFKLAGAPARLELNYVRQVANGIHKGIETSHMQAINAALIIRLGCKGSMCFRLDETLSMGRALTQGNPVCDGSLPRDYNLSPCPRSGAIGGGASAAILLEFPRRREIEKDLF